MNSTISGNSAGGTGKGGGLVNSAGTLTLTNTIIAGSGGDCVDTNGGTIATNSHNLVHTL